MNIKNIPLIVITIFLCSNTFAQITGNDKLLQFESLKWLYESIRNSDKDILLDNWDFSNNPDSIIDNTWAGITTDTDGYITHIDISGKDLIADFDRDSNNRLCLVRLSKLREVNFSNNLFTGYIPHIWYTENPYPGSQTPVYSLPVLEKLDFSNNSFRGSFAIQNSSPIVEELRLSNNRLDNITIENCNTIRVIDISGNNFGLGIFSLYWPVSCNPVLDTFDVRGNNLYFDNLWVASDPERTDTWNLFNNNSFEFLIIPQESVSWHNVIYRNKVRAIPGDSVNIKIPDVGQYSELYPEIKDSLRYEWYKNGELISDSTAFLKRDQIANEDYATYYCNISYTGQRLNQLTLTTDTFSIVNEVNQPPVISISNGLSQYQRFNKGSFSRLTILEITDDIPISDPAARNSTFEFIKYPTHLQLMSDNPGGIMVKDTTAMWTGIDTVTVRFCDFEGMCTDFSIYYEVFDWFVPPPLEIISSNEQKELIIKWNTGIYETKVHKPDGYLLVVDTCNNPVGMGQYVNYISLYSEGRNSDSAKFIIPESDIDYVMKLSLSSYKNDTVFSDFITVLYIPVPVKADTLIKAEFADGDISVIWRLNNHPGTIEYAKTNTIYESSNGTDFERLTYTYPNDTVYTYSPDQYYDQLWYKMIKRTISIGGEFEIELPYLQSNILEYNYLSIVNNLHDSIQNKIRIYPNPAKNDITINCNDVNINNIQLIDSNGKKIIEHKNSGTTKDIIEINLSMIPAGIYFIKISTDNGFFIRKIVKD